ncbi:hypothetical protein CIRMBP1248_01857 [Enterococcus cecorum]|nr:hypothetical protein CIRMBP1256_01618 [Enterococcus cecorum]CAI3424625.1 hypothetical protein CIRMBP1248_01857 [Enterococcus cecorum]
MPIDFKDMFTNVSGQVLIILGIVGVVLILAGIFTQGIARTIAMVLGIFVLAMLVVLLGNTPEIGEWLKNQIWKGGGTGTGGNVAGLPIKVWMTTHGV